MAPGLGSALQPRKLLLHLLQRLPLEHAHARVASSTTKPRASLMIPMSIISPAMSSWIAHGHLWHRPCCAPLARPRQDDAIVHDALLGSVLGREPLLSPKILRLFVHFALNDRVLKFLRTCGMPSR